MKYIVQFLNKYEKITSFQVYENILYLLSNNKLHVITKDIILKHDFNSSSLYLYKGKVFSGKNFYYDFETNEINLINELKDYYYTNVFFGNYLIFSNLDMVIYSMESKKIELVFPFKEDCGLTIIHNNISIFRGDDYYVGCLLENTECSIWQQSFTDLLQSEEVLLRYYYVYQEKLILHLRTNGLPQNKYVSIVLDVNTGKELYRTEETLGKKLINGLGYTLYDQTLWISNPETYEVKRIDLSETLFPLNKIIDDKIGDVDLGKTEVKFRFSPDYFSVDYPYLYFSEQRGLQVGVLNIETKELLFHTEIEEKGLVKDLKSSNGKFFVHTTENNLYVFG